MSKSSTQDSILDWVGRKIAEAIERLQDALVPPPEPSPAPVRVPVPRRR